MIRTTARTACKAHRCDSCLASIPSSHHHLVHTISPDHDDIGNVGWQTSRECADCAIRYGRGDLLSTGTTSSG